MRDPEQLTCRELVELVTDYLEDGLLPEERTMFEEHLVYCRPCVNYLGEMRRTVEVVGALREEHIPSEARDALLEAFRGWRGARR